VGLSTIFNLPNVPRIDGPLRCECSAPYRSGPREINANRPLHRCHACDSKVERDTSGGVEPPHARPVKSWVTPVKRVALKAKSANAVEGALIAADFLLIIKRDISQPEI
jgi:hypothetical protein